jgi:hypothetical protein
VVQNNDYENITVKFLRKTNISFYNKETESQRHTVPYAMLHFGIVCQIEAWDPLVLA